MSASITIKAVTDYLEQLAPRAFQESYDNAGLLCGDSKSPVKGILITLDCIEEVVEEAIQTGCNLIVAHHPIIFKGLKRITGGNYIERTILKAIKNDVAIYAIHTNLDNVHTGVNRKISEKIGLQNLSILVPKRDTLGKLVTFVPHEHKAQVLEGLYRAGAGQIGNYKDCSFSINGTGSFTPNENAAPFIGQSQQAETVEESRIEVIFPLHLERQLMSALRQSHPYEEVAYYLSTLTNSNQEVGAGMIGELPEAQEPFDFLRGLKTKMNLQVIRHTAAVPRKIKKVAVCGGAGSFLLPNALAAGADAFVSADFKYHEFFDAEGKLIVADIGHYESEVFTKDLLKDVLMKNFHTFAINFSNTVTNPISYL